MNKKSPLFPLPSLTTLPPLSVTMMEIDAKLTLSESENASIILSPEDPTVPADVEALRRLSDNLSSIFQSPDFDPFVDTRISVGPGLKVGAHRCVLSARSPFFREVFRKKEKGSGIVKLELRELVKEFQVGFDALVAVLGYLYSGRVGPLPKGVCVCVDDECAHVGCRPSVDFVVEMLYASYVFQVDELVSLFQRHLLDILDKVAIDDIPIILTVANLCSDTCTKLLTGCIEIVASSDLDAVTLEKSLPPGIVKLIVESRQKLGLVGPGCSDFPDKHVRRIYRALESDDVELVRMLLREGNTSLDDAYALHYAVAHCDSKITTELLDLGLADVNHRNARGYTVLHIAAMRKEPKIIVSLLTKGARPADLTSDGIKALQIAKRLTKHVDYRNSTEEGKASPKDRLCIEILEQAERRDPLIGEASVSLAIAGDDLRGKLLYLENRVALARMLFPVEARVAMDIAHVDGTLEFTLGSMINLPIGSQRSTVDLNEAPFKIKEEHLARMRALSRTVELGKRFFPRCSEVLNKIMDDDTDIASFARDNTSEERKRRYLELQDVFEKAFTADKEELDISTLSSSSSSASVGIAWTSGS